VISLAQLTQAPIIPVSWDVTRKVVVNSWDNFIVPLPFARATMRIGAPMMVAAGLSDAEFEGKRVELETVLKGMDEGDEKAPKCPGA
jgi:hypothetical protein